MIHIRGKRSKYGNKKAEIDGFKFDSMKEAKRYGELKLLEKAGEITGIKVHPIFPIIVKDTKICTYIADFQYWRNLKEVNKRPESIVEDVKGMKRGTPIFRLKKKLISAIYDIEIQGI